MAVDGVVTDDLVYCVRLPEVEAVGCAELVRGAVGTVARVFLDGDVGAFERLSRRNLSEHRRLGDIDGTHPSLVYGAVKLLPSVTYVHYAVTDAFVEIQAVIAVRAVLASIYSSTEDELLTDIGE